MQCYKNLLLLLLLILLSFINEQECDTIEQKNPKIFYIQINATSNFAAGQVYKGLAMLRVFKLCRRIASCSENYVMLCKKFFFTSKIEI